VELNHVVRFGDLGEGVDGAVELLARTRNVEDESPIGTSGTASDPSRNSFAV